jgi:hypothetical protein
MFILNYYFKNVVIDKLWPTRHDTTYDSGRAWTGSFRAWSNRARTGLARHERLDIYRLGCGCE